MFDFESGHPVYTIHDVLAYYRVKNKLLPIFRTFREITFFMLCVTRIFKSNFFECLRLVTLNCEVKGRIQEQFMRQVRA
jgi:hypothetical protein